MILVTGATGFIGRHVLDLLLKRGDTVVTFGRCRPSVSVEHSNRHFHITGDLSTGMGLAEVPWSEIHQVVHLAAAGVKATRRAWPETLAVNVVGMQRLLTAINESIARPRVFIARTFYEDVVEANPALLENPYIATKHAATQLARLFARNYMGEVVFGTFFQVYGPGDDSGNVLSYAAKEFSAGRVPIFGSGQGLRDWIYIDDAAAGVLACLKAPLAGRVGEFDLGTGKLVSIRQMIEAVASTLGVSQPPIFDPSRDRPDGGFALAATKLPPNWRAGINISIGVTQFKNITQK